VSVYYETAEVETCAVVKANVNANFSANFSAYSDIIIIIIQAFVRRTMSANILNLRRRQSLGEEDGESEL